MPTDPIRPVPKQLVWTFVVAGLAIVLWTLATVGAITDEIHPLHAPLINLCIGMAATASVAATKTGLDYRRSGREAARHTELLDAVRAGHALQEGHHAMVVEQIEQVANRAITVSTEKLDTVAEALSEAISQARWKGFAEGLKEGLPSRGSDGAEVVPMDRGNGAPRPRRLTGDS